MVISYIFIMYPLSTVPPVPDVASLFSPSYITQWLLIIGSITTIVWTVIKNKIEKRKGNQDLQKSAYDQLETENKRLITTLDRKRKEADKFFILRDLCSHTEYGRSLIVETEAIADQIDSYEK